MEVGILVIYEFMDFLVEFYLDGNWCILYGWLLFNMLWCDICRGYESYVWYNLLGKWWMFFKNDLNIGDGMFYVLGVIYIIKNERMDIFVYKGKKLDGRILFYLVFFFNVIGGNVCLGNFILEKLESLDFYILLEYWEKCFWFSEFFYFGGGKNLIRNNLVLVIEWMCE